MTDKLKSPTLVECINDLNLLRRTCAAHHVKDLEKLHTALGKYLAERQAQLTDGDASQPQGQEYFLYTDENGKPFYQLTLGRDTLHLQECLSKAGKARSELLRVRLTQADTHKLCAPDADPVEIPLTMDDELVLDTNMTTAIENWLKCGIYPGQCVWYLLRGNYKEAYSRAHELIKPHWDHHVRYAESLPVEARGSNMESWQAYFEMDAE